MEPDRRSNTWLPSVLCLIGGLIVLGIFVFLFRKPDISASDNILLTLASVIISSAISVYLGWLFSYREALQRLEGEARKALRRIVCIKDMAIRSLQNSERITVKISSSEDEALDKNLILEYFTGIQHQLSDLISNVEFSIQDWGDMLAQDVKELRASDIQKIELYKKMHEEMTNLITKFDKKLEEATGRQREELTQEMKKQQMEIRASLAKGLAQINAATPVFSTTASGTTATPVDVSSFMEPEPFLLKVFRGKAELPNLAEAAAKGPPKVKDKKS